MTNRNSLKDVRRVSIIISVAIFYICMPAMVVAQADMSRGINLGPSGERDSDTFVSYSEFNTASFQAIISPENDSKKVSWAGLTATTVVLAGIYAGLFNYEQDRRWDGPESDFHFTHSLSARGADKAGHFYAAKSQASLISNLYSLSNVNRQVSDLIGAGVTLSVHTFIELKDGRIDDRGFDIYDEVANLLGVGWYYTRERSSFLQNFQIRWFYYPSSNHELLAPGHRFTEDYTGHSYWLGLKIANLTAHWPKFIVPVGGINLNDWVPNSSQQGTYSVHLSLNPDFDYIFPRKTAWGRTFADFFNSFYIPAPAIEVYPNFGFSILFYGQH